MNIIPGTNSRGEIQKLNGILEEREGKYEEDGTVEEYKYQDPRGPKGPTENRFNQEISMTYCTENDTN